MSDIADCQNVTDDAVSVTVDGVDVCLDVVSDHLTLELSTLVSVKSHIVGVLVEGKGSHVQLAGGAVGRLTVVPYKRLILVGYFLGRCSFFSLCLCGLGLSSCCSSSGLFRGTAAAANQAEGHNGSSR